MAQKLGPRGEGADAWLVPSELHDRIDYLLCKVSDTVKRRVDEEFSRYDLRGAHHALLRVLGACGPLSQQDMAGRLFVDPSTIVDLVDHLQKRGLVRRRRSDQDRRVSLLELTDEGQARLAASDERAGSMQPDIFAALPTGDQQLLRDLLLRLAAREP